MKTILIVFLITVVFIISMSFIEAQRTNYLNKINLEYQQSLEQLGLSIDNDSSSSLDNEDDGKITVSISGAINKGGEYTLDLDSSLSDLLEKAIIKSSADASCYNLDYILEDNDTIYIPNSNNDNKISINTADVNTLDLLPSIGSTLASRIVEYRESNGEFQCIDHIKRVEGIGVTAFNKIKDYIKL